MCLTWNQLLYKSSKEHAAYAEIWSSYIRCSSEYILTVANSRAVSWALLTQTSIKWRAHYTRAYSTWFKVIRFGLCIPMNPIIDTIHTTTSSHYTHVIRLITNDILTGFYISLLVDYDNVRITIHVGPLRPLFNFNNRTRREMDAMAPF